MSTGIIGIWSCLAPTAGRPYGKRRMWTFRSRHRLASIRVRQCQPGRCDRIIDPFGHEWEIGKPIGLWDASDNALAIELPLRDAVAGLVGMATIVPEMRSAFRTQGFVVVPDVL